MARKDSMNEESAGNLTMYVKVSTSKHPFGVWEVESKDSQEVRINMKTK